MENLASRDAILTFFLFLYQSLAIHIHNSIAILFLVLAINKKAADTSGPVTEVPPSDWRPQVGHGKEDKNETLCLSLGAYLEELD